MSDKQTQYSFRTLHAEILQDLADVERVVNDCTSLYDDVASAPLPEQHEMLALAAYVHHFYTGTESMFERVVDMVDQQKLAGGDWHRQLLRRVSLDLPDLRPPVISRSTHGRLDEYRGFRQVFRHARGIAIDWKRLKLLLDNLRHAYQSLQHDVRQFLGFLEDAIKCNELCDAEERQS